MLIKNFDKLDKLTQESTRNAWGETLLALAKKNKDIVVVSADLAESTRVENFGKKYPERFFEVGVAEQNMTGIAAGLALSDKIPCMTSFGVFSPGRNWDQIRVSICYGKANVKIVSTHCGLSVGQDGASHQALEDIAITRCLPNMTVIAPSDARQTKKAVEAIINHKGPVYLRLTRPNTPVFTSTKTNFKIGRANVLLKGSALTIVACGPIIHQALLVAKKLNAEVIDCHTIKPLDKTTILRSVKKTGRLITLEDHQIMGGLGSAITEMLAQNYPVPTTMLGVQDSFGESGAPDKLYDKYGLSTRHIVAAAKNLLKK
jgi:transketolase